MHVICETFVTFLCFGSNDWTLSPNSDNSNNALNVNSNGYVNNNNVMRDYPVFPVVFLKSTIP